LGVPRNTNKAAFHCELGLIDQSFRAQAAALKFRSHIIGLPNRRLVKPVYIALRSEASTEIGGPKYIQNSAADFFEPLAIDLDLCEHLSGTVTAKGKARDILCYLRKNKLLTQSATYITIQIPMK
jgi:hypothetical protein